MKKIHFVGIGGSGISGVAGLAKKFGFEVSGCDSEKQSSYLENLVGHDVSHVDLADLVVASPALLFDKTENAEISLAKKQNKFMTWQQFLGTYLQNGKSVICIAGTHGKSTTTAMAGKMLVDAGLDPLVMVGAKVPEWQASYRFGKGAYFVTEADEFNNNFLNYSPEIAVINNIEFDHPDFFLNKEDMMVSFGNFVKKLTGKKILIVNEDSPDVIKLLSAVPSDVTVIKYSAKKQTNEFKLKVPGQYNVSNATGVYELGKVLGIKDEVIKQSLNAFSGVERRSELVGRFFGISIYDDYAHHPSAISATLDGFRDLYPKNRIVVIVEPHGFSRTKSVLSLYKDAFAKADKVLIGPIFKARDSETFGVSNKDIVNVSDHKNISSFDNFNDIKKAFLQNLKKDDVVVVMGAGKSYLWTQEIKDDLAKTSFSKITTFKTGGDIEYYFEVSNIDEVKSKVGFAHNKKLPIFIVGGGTDILVSDKKFVGVVLKYVGNKFEINNNGLVVAEAGLGWDELVKEAVARGFAGIECLSGIPGSVGAAPIQNIGAYGQELKNTFVSLLAYDIENEKTINFSKEQCQFGYRESIFKKKDYWQKYLILNVSLQLNKNNNYGPKYESLNKYITSQLPSLEEVRRAVLKVRADKLEDPKTVGNAGSFFKNPIVDLKHKQELEKKFEGIKFYSFGSKFKVSAGWLIEQVGWKGRNYKTAGVSKKHALILINADGNAKSKDVYELSKIIIKDVKDKFGITLKREVQLINF